MKKQMTRNLRNARIQILPALLFSLLTLSFTGTVHAQTSTASTSKPVIKYLGRSDDQLVFQVDYNNLSDETFNVSIKDEDGNLIYVDRFRDKKFSKKFRINESEYGAMKLTFVFSSGKDYQAQAFQINTNSHVVDDVVVTNL